LPDRRLDDDLHRRAGFVPYAVAVRAAHAEQILPRSHVRVTRLGLVAGGDPAGIESLELVRVLIVGRRREVERRELEGEEVVVPRELERAARKERRRQRQRRIELAE